LSDGGKTTVLDLLGVKLKSTLGELETLLNESLELTDSASLVTENLLGVGGSDDDFGTSVGDSDLTSRVSLLGELTSAEVSFVSCCPRPRLLQYGVKFPSDPKMSMFRYIDSEKCKFERVIRARTETRLTRTRQARPGRHRRR